MLGSKISAVCRTPSVPVPPAISTLPSPMRAAACPLRSSAIVAASVDVPVEGSKISRSPRQKLVDRASGDEHAAVLEQGGRVAGTRFEKLSRGGEGAVSRVEYDDGSGGGSVGQAARDEGTAVGERHGGGADAVLWRGANGSPRADFLWRFGAQQQTGARYERHDCEDESESSNHVLLSPSRDAAAHVCGGNSTTWQFDRRDRSEIEPTVAGQLMCPAISAIRCAVPRTKASKQKPFFR